MIKQTNKWHKFINDTLKNTKGIWSLKRALAVILLSLDLILGIYIVISDYILQHEINRYAIDVFNSLLIAVMALLGITEMGKKFKNVFESDDNYYTNQNQDDNYTQKPDRTDG